jgi:hypothetical protein
MNENEINSTLFLYNIYDGKLSKTFGSDPSKLIPIINNTFQDVKTDITMINGTYNEIYSSLLKILTEIEIEYHRPDNFHMRDNYMVPFGTPEHATILYFKNYPNERCVICTFINTGLGLNYHDVNEDKTKYDLYKYYIIQYGEQHIFLKKIYPFLVIKYAIIENDIDLDDFIKLIRKKDTSKINSDGFLRALYNNMYALNNQNPNFIYKKITKLFNDKYIFNELERINFSKFVIEYKSFVQEINTYCDNIDEDKLLINDLTHLNRTFIYFKLSCNNIKVEYNDIEHKIYFNQQKSGTCVFRSLLMGIFYSMIINDKTNIIPKYRIFLARSFSLKKYLKKIYDEHYTESCNSNNLIDMLVTDHIFENEYIFENVIINTMNYPFKIMEYHKTIINHATPITVGHIDTDRINEIVDKIRHKMYILPDATDTPDIDYDDNMIMASQLVEEIKKIVYDTSGEYIGNIINIIIIAYLWEYYYRYEEWKTQFADLNMMKFNCTNMYITLSDINLYNHEIIWISNFINAYYSKIHNIDHIYKYFDNTYINQKKKKFCEDNKLYVLYSFFKIETISFNMEFNLLNSYMYNNYFNSTFTNFISNNYNVNYGYHDDMSYVRNKIINYYGINYGINYSGSYKTIEYILNNNYLEDYQNNINDINKIQNIVFILIFYSNKLETKILKYNIIKLIKLIMSINVPDIMFNTNYFDHLFNLIYYLVYDVILINNNINLKNITVQTKEKYSLNIGDSKFGIYLYKKNANFEICKIYMYLHYTQNKDIFKYFYDDIFQIIKDKSTK